MSVAPAALRIHPDDSVAVALRPLSAGETVEVAGQRIALSQDVPQGHKIALRPHREGEPVTRYGHPIGRATAPIEFGEHVHSHNLATALQAGGEYAYEPQPAPSSPAPARASTFQGYLRADGRVGTRNEIWVLNTVGCVNATAARVAKAGAQIVEKRGGADGVHAFAHPFGCSQLGDDLSATRDVLRGLAVHPNAGGVVLIGLGCENNQLDAFLDGLPEAARERVVPYAAQSVFDEEEEGIRAVETLLERMSGDRRETRPASDLTLGMKCGGSDALSGLTANPLVGRMTDRVTAAGGSALLTEVPEMFGAERLLMNRAENKAVYDEIVRMVTGFKDYFVRHDQPVYENPSPGNKEGGLTTLEEKSLGAVQKGGSATVTDVLSYAQPRRRPGLSLLTAPGNDAVSCTALAVSGATVILFTTGRGTPLGFPVPTLKIASNSTLAERKPRWIDFDAGPVATGEATVEEAADALWDKILRTASGEAARNEENGYREIAMWKTGVTL
ncbi:UxaA family hydrolase [Parvularcula dongshanensis]|uniref:Altronate hydrolase n=1 Tax=Parvularcula dongshanensis TaxID=1173995 RepID=A0A840I6E6_9PROT|nr:altronate dehydratase family protein [Parvularcula dongshanensis]MBB4659580.1 altronate hydrolase [Parvularcula dongshanensis]